MLFGKTDIDRIQLNEFSLWTGYRVPEEGRVLGETIEKEEQNLGAYQAFGDAFVHLGHDLPTVSHCRRELDIDSAVHQVT
jgi:alpha-L-fucosidase 2